MAEFALVLPILAFLLFAVIQFGIAFNNYITLTDATRAGARKAAASTTRRDPNPQSHLRGSCAQLRERPKAREPDCRLPIRLAARVGRSRHRDLPLLDQLARPVLEVRKPDEHYHGANRMKIMNQRGQSMVMSIVFLTVLMGMSALVIDVGSWYRAHRAAQSTADASALAGAQGLPDTAQATALANEYAGKNSGTSPGAVGPADHVQPAGLRDRHDPGHGHEAASRLLREVVRLQLGQREGPRDRARLERRAGQGRRADHRQLQASAAELHPRRAPDVQSQLRYIPRP